MKKIIAFISLSLLLSSCGTPEVVLEKYYSTRISEESKIDITDSFVWYVRSDITTTLSSEVGWEILSTLVKEWQKISAGTEIARINVDTSTLAYLWGDNIQASLESMKQSIAESFDTQVSVTKSQLAQARIEQEANTIALTDTTALHSKQSDALISNIKVAAESLDTAKAEKSETKKIFETKESTLYSNAKNALTALIILDTNINTFVDEVYELTKENDYKNDDYYQFLGAKDSWLKEKTRNEAIIIRNSFLSLKNFYETKINSLANPVTWDIEKWLQDALTYNDELKVFLSHFYDVFNSSIESEPYFGKSIIEWQKNRISQYGQQIEQALISTSGDMLLWVKGSLQSLDALRDEKSKVLTLLDKKVLLAEASLESINTNALMTPVTQQTQIHQTETNKKMIEEKINQIQESLKNLEASKKARLDEINSQLTKARVETSLQRLSAEKGTITSPISGIITKKYIEIGNVIWPWQQLVEVSDDSSKKVVTGIPASTLENIKIWDEVWVLIDGKDALIKGKISTIYPFQNEKTRKTQIEIRTLETNSMMLWSRVKVYLTKQTSAGVTIPKKAIVQTYSLPGVYVVNSGKATFKHINIIDQNEDFAIVEWIFSNTEIIVLGKENIFDGEDLSQYKKLPE